MNSKTNKVTKRTSNSRIFEFIQGLTGNAMSYIASIKPRPLLEYFY